MVKFYQVSEVLTFYSLRILIQGLNMFKTVLISYCGRQKKVKFSKTEAESDLDALTRALIHDAQRDTFLKNTINSATAFYITAYDNVFKRDVQLDSYEEIHDLRDDLKIVFEYTCTTQIGQEQPYDGLQHVDCSVSTPKHSTPIKVKIVVGDAHESTLTPVKDCAELAEEANHQEIGPSGSGSLQAPKKFFVPKVDGNLLLQDRKILNGFIRSCASSILMKSDRPSPDDYSLFSDIVIKSYPQLADRFGQKHRSFKMQLQACIRNRRYSSSHEPKKPRKELSFNTSCINSAAIDGIDIKELLQEIKKIDTKDSPHLKKLMDATFEYRRGFIEKEAKNCAEILTAFPVLGTESGVKRNTLLVKNCSSIISYVEFQIMEEMKKMFAEIVFKNAKQNFEKVLYKVSKIFCGEFPDTERSKLQLMLKVHNETTPKRLKATPLITIKNVNEEIDVSCGECDAPHVVVYLDKDAICTSVLLAESSLLAILPASSTTCDVLLMLIASYYVFHIKFPPNFECLLLLLQHEILEMPNDGAKPTLATSKFWRKYCNVNG